MDNLAACLEHAALQKLHTEARILDAKARLKELRSEGSKAEASVMTARLEVQAAQAAHAAAHSSRKAAEEELAQLQAASAKLKQEIQALTDEGHQLVEREQAEKAAFVLRTDKLRNATRDLASQIDATDKDTLSDQQLPLKWLDTCRKPAGVLETSDIKLERSLWEPMALGMFESDAQEFDRWFPGLRRSGTSLPQPQLTVLCVPPAGCAEDIFTSEGTGTRRSPNPLLAHAVNHVQKRVVAHAFQDWCRAHGAEILAVQLPGRGQRLREALTPCARTLAHDILRVARSRLAAPGRPWAVISHSMGCWITFELLRACPGAGVPLPVLWALSAMPPPDIPAAARPWRRQELLDEAQFKDECRAWDINEVVFSDSMWPIYQPLLRADFTVFDGYVAPPDCAAAPFPGLRICAWWGSRDRRVTSDMVQGWAHYTTGEFKCRMAEGNHLWPLDKNHRAAWLREVVMEMEHAVHEAC